MAVSGQLINTGGVVTSVLSGVVNSTITSPILNETTVNVWIDGLQFSNSSDFSSTVTPTAGHIDFEFTTDGLIWETFRSGALLAKTGQQAHAKATGDIRQVRIVSSGVTGATYVRVNVKETFTIDSSIDTRVYLGTQALTVQPFLEANCKNGVQYEITAYNAALAAGANQDVIIVTGNLPVLIKSRQLNFDGDLLVTNSYMNPTYTGGTPMPYYNMSTWLPVPGQAVFLAGATVTDVGTQAAATITAIGNNQPGASTISSFGAYMVGGLERVLAPNSTYLFRTTNPTLDAQRVSVYATWYEGALNIHN